MTDHDKCFAEIRRLKDALQASIDERELLCKQLEASEDALRRALLRASSQEPSE